MHRNRRAHRPLRVLLLSAAISAVLVGRTQAQTSPFVRRGADPGAQAAAAAQQQGLASAKAGQLAQKSLQAFQRAAQTRQALDAAQAAARAAAQAAQAGAVPDGLGKGALQLPDGAIIDPGAVRSDDPRLGQRNVWLGARAPTQQVVGGDTQVTIQQTQKKAILNWETFNVGSRTRLQFDQSAGGSDAAQWIALNRVNDPSAAPSKILGSIQAPGQVYLLNRNGVLFGGASQVNAHSLLVSSLDLFDSNRALSDQTFLARGLFGVASQTGVVLTGLDGVAAGQTPGDIRIDSGARLFSGSQGYTLIAAPNVSNAGTVTAQDGQAMLAAVLGLRQSTALPSAAGNVLPVGFSGFSLPGAAMGQIGMLDNSGVVAASRGDATLVGYDLRQRGVVSATTSISRPGNVSLLAIDQNGSFTDSGNVSPIPHLGGRLELAAGALTAVLPERDGETTTSGASADQAFVAPSLTLAGAQVRIGSDTQVLAPGATVNVTGLGRNNAPSRGRDLLNNRILVEDGAQLSVSGLADVQRDMSSNLVQIPRVGQNELADSPLQRDGALFRQALQFDRRASGTRADGVTWVGSPLLNAQGYVDQVPRTIDDMLLDGGTINLRGSDVVLNPGARLDLDGGYLHVRGGMVETPRLLGSDGRLYDLASADPSLTYVGIAGDQTHNHARWGVTERYSNPLLGSRRYYESDYLEGGDAGSLNIALDRHYDNEQGRETLGALVLGGALSAQAVSGRYQVSSAAPARGGALHLDGGDGRSWQIVADTSAPAGLDLDTSVEALPDAGLAPQDPRHPGYWSQLSARWVQDAGLASVDVKTANGVIEVAADARLQVADGGSIALDGGRVDVRGTLIARAGDIALDSLGGELRIAAPGDALLAFGRGDLLVGAGALLDVSGRWVNDDRRLTQAPQGQAFIDGGTLSLRTQQRADADADGVRRDGTGSILIAPGAALRANSGGYVDADGELAMRDGRPLGRGGDIGLQTYLRPSGDSAASPTYVVDLAPADGAGRLQFDPASLQADSFAGGGTLTLRALGVQIGGDAPADARILQLDPAFFAAHGFGGYDLAAELDAGIATGTQVRVSQRNLLPDVQALRAASSDTDVLAGLPRDGGNGYVRLGQLDPFHRPATDFALRAGDYLGRVAGNPIRNGASGTLELAQGAQLTLDPGATVRLGSRGQVNVFGQISAHGGEVVLSGDTSQQSGLSPPPDGDSGRAYADAGKSVWLGADSRVDVSGIALPDPAPTLRPSERGPVATRGGRVLGGGTVTLSNDGGYVVVEAGAQLDLSGASAVFDLPTGAGLFGGAAPSLQAQSVWSDGGRLTLAASAGLFFDGRIQAHGGAAQAQGGTLALLPLSQAGSRNPNGFAAKGLIFTQSDSHLPAGARPGQALEPTLAAPSGLLYFAADRLADSGIQTLYAGVQNPSGSDATPPLVPIGFSGDVDLSLARALVFNAPSYSLLAPQADRFGELADRGQVTLSAAYVGLNGWRPATADAALPEPPAPGAATLTVQAQHIDLGGQFALNGVGLAQFHSQGDLRLHTPAAYAFQGTDTPLPRAGELLTAGNLEFRATQLYPASGETFLIRALGAPDPQTGVRADTRIDIADHGGNAALPLSAGGTLALDATEIEQHGTVRAPGGRLLLGAGATGEDATARALFGTRTLAPTRRVSLGAGSVTSVSLAGAVLPYGSTVDGSQWRYGVNPQASNADLAAPPQKQIRLQAAEVELGAGAQIDLSGGGDLQAIEWVPGTGGSRDLLSRYNTSYASGNAQQVPLYADAREVYAIVPGVQTPVAATDALFEQGDAAPALGRAVQLSGVPGLADGVYTLLPAKYATLPGAYRVVARSGSQDATATQNQIAPDGTAMVAGHYVDTLSGARDARSSLFEVQSRATWGQYSEYTLTGANSFFAGLATRQGNATPQLPRDGGQLVLSADQRLQLGATLATAAASGGAAAQVDITARALQVRGQGQAALDGYVSVDVAALNALNAGSLLLGGTREQTAAGTLLHVGAEHVLVNNDARDPLRAPELILVAGASADGGVQVANGSVLQAQGGSGTASSTALLIGDSDPAGASGDGALLRLSSYGDAALQRRNVPDATLAQGRLRVGDGAQLLGGASLNLDSTGDTEVAAGARLQGDAITASAGQVRLDGAAAATDADGLVVGAASLAQFADARRVSLRSYGDMSFASGLDLSVDNALNLSAARFVGDGSTVRLRADQLTLSNEIGTSPAADGASGGGLLQLQGREVAFGSGDKRLAGFGAVAVDAEQALFVRGQGEFDFGTREVTLRAPVLMADAGADNRLVTQGALHLQRNGGTASAATPLGGRVGLVGGSIDGDGAIRARSGSVDLHATHGDLRLDSGASIDVSGTTQVFFDTPTYTAGGDIALRADRGAVTAAASTLLDFSAAGSADAGSLDIATPLGAARLLGTLDGAAGSGRGGRFALDSGAAVDLDALAPQLAVSGIDGAIDIHARSGNLSLSAGRSLQAQRVSLTADGGADALLRDAGNGNVRIDGLIDASGTQGGDIALWGRHGVAVNGQLLARGSAADRRGGNIVLGSSGREDGTLNAEHGYQNVQAAAAGTIAIGAGALLDVSGGSAGGLSGGSVQLRAPLLADGEVNVTIADGARIAGAREVGLEAYAVWSTTDASSDPTQHFDGIVDPAGWYDAQGQLLPGSWTDTAGNALAAPSTPAQLADYLSRHLFTPDAANAAHRQFYGYRDDATAAPGTLMGFVQQPGFAFAGRFAGIANFRARPGIELRNPDPAINGGAISVLTSWNLGSGATRDALDFRYNGAAPVLTLRAAQEVTIKASLSDGFYQLRNPFGSGGPQASYDDAAGQYQGLTEMYLGFGLSIDALIPMPSAQDGDDAQAQQYYGQYLQLLAMLQKPQSELSTDPTIPIGLLDGFLLSYAPELGSVVEQFPGQPAPPPSPTAPADYPGYLASYERYVLDLYAFWSQTGFGTLPTYVPPSLPVVGALLPADTHNTPSSLQASRSNPLPLATASLIGGDSSRYRIVAGADFASVRPDALRQDAAADVVLDGHQRYQQEGQKDVLLPTVLRTGTGSIQIAAARDLRFADADAPASIYTAGRPADGSAIGTDTYVARGSVDSRAADVVIGAQANAEAGGDLSLQANRDIVGNRQIFDTDGSRSGVVGNYVGQYWWPWMQLGNPLGADGTPVAAQINYGGFAQGVMSSGGDVAVDAGRDIRELSVSLPTSYIEDAQGRRVFGGGNLSVDAGRDVLGGDYFVANGEGRLRAGGRLGTAFDLQAQGYDGGGELRQVESAVDPVFALQDAQWSIQARGDAAIGAIVNPTYVIPNEGGIPALLATDRISQDYSADSSVQIAALDGDIRLKTLKLPGLLFGFGERDNNRPLPDSVALSQQVFDNVLPARLEAIAQHGAIQVEGAARLFPSATGQLALLARDDIALFNDSVLPGTSLWMLDAPGAYAGNDLSVPDRNQLLNLHRNDAAPALLYSLDGDIVNGFAADGYRLNPLTLDLPKPARIRAGRDIVNLDLRAQNYRAGDVTRVVAGRDLYYTPIQGAPLDPGYVARWGWLQLGGPGTFEVQAGRNLGPLTSANEALAAVQGANIDALAGGIRTIGNRNNPGLPSTGATLVARFGAAPGEDADAFTALYLDPASAQSQDAYRRWLVEFVLQQRNDAREREGQAPLQDLPVAQAWTAFQQLPGEDRRLLVERVFLDVLKQVGEGYADPASADYQQYARGYQAIEALYPARLGYTANNLQGGANGAAARVDTGALDMRGSTLQTEEGGDIRVLGPGGGMQVGSALAPPAVFDTQGTVLIGPAQQGILALGQGDVGVFTDASVLLAQSRIFTQRGGDLAMWSSNGDINAGKGAKTSSEKSRASYQCDLDRYCTLNARGQVSGAGIATLRVDPADPQGDVVLVAPRGTVDAGDAGIRVSGNLIVASQFVANADNIQVQGDTVGVGSARGVDGGTLSAASNAAAAVSDAVGDMASRGNTPPREAPSVITVQVIGLGDCAMDDPRCQPGP
ncbi:filamentous hemagglutinin family protein [Xanthomonas sp. AmX2]|uniref:filamentous haemagglutinin family protein n=1 Tax=Xanthomonas sp. TaxID=29446 RepID=UPI0019818F62|nr:filamentous haemagglutinin family protein [Xanthomonas sp.]MBN6149807.1 filamentous hemagglutinin family protein [Xanthomonas sp.]